MSKDIITNLSLMGCGFATAQQNITDSPDPEKTILNALEYFFTDKKIFTMLIGLMKYKIYRVINTQRLLELSKNLSPNLKVLLGIICLKIYKHTSDVRYLIIANKIKRMKIKLNKYPIQYSDEFYIKRLGLDKEFKHFGIKIANFFDLQHEKKFKSIENIYIDNPWLRMRAIIGPDYRADVFYMRMIDISQSQNDLVRKIGCDKSSVSRHWSALQGFEELSRYIKL